MVVIPTSSVTLHIPFATLSSANLSFIDKIFAAEFYYERKMYEDVSKHLY